MSVPLDGIRILSLTQIGQGPAAVQLLADLGAEVIKVERPGSGEWGRNWAGADAFRNGESFLFLGLNRNQRGITVNLKEERGKVIIHQLAEDADVFIENYRPGVMEGLGFGFDALAALNPRLIYCSTNGFGSTGPYAAWPGQDLVVQGLSGLAAMTGRDTDAPTPVGSPVVDFHAAALAAFAICAALIHRDRSGRGQKVETSLLEAAVHLQWEPLFYFLNGWDVTCRSEAGLGSTYHQAPYGVYETSDGHITLSLNPLERLAEAFGLADLNTYSREDTLSKRDEIKRLVESVTKTKTMSENLEVLRKHDIWCGPVLSYHELVKDPQFEASQFETKLSHSRAGELHHLRPPVRFSSLPLSDIPMTPPPLLGQHTDEVLTEIGYQGHEIETLRREGVV